MAASSSHLALPPSPTPPCATDAAKLLASTTRLPVRQFLQLHAHLIRTGFLAVSPAAATSFLCLAAASLPSPRALAVLNHHFRLTARKFNVEPLSSSPLSHPSPDPGAMASSPSHLALPPSPTPPCATDAAELLASTSRLPVRQFLQLHAHVIRTGFLAVSPAAATSFLSLATASLPSPRALALLNHHFTLSAQKFKVEPSSSSSLSRPPPGPREMASSSSHLALPPSPTPPGATDAAELLASTSRLPVRQFLQLHAHVIRTGFLVAATSFLCLAAASLPSPRALAVLDHHLTPATLPTTYSCNTILRALSDLCDALRFLCRMRSLGLRGNAFTLAFLLKPRCTLAHARQIHANVVAEGHLRDAFLSIALMRCYAACGDWDGVCRLFDEMPVRDTVAWNVLITCYMRNKRTKDALKLFEEMMHWNSEAKPNDVTCILLLQACTSLGALDFGEQVWAFAEVHGYGTKLKVRNSLIAMYSRCGCLDMAYQVFCETRWKSVVTWSAMISGLAANGFGKDAISAFDEMIRSDVAPDEQTFTSVLSACSRSGLVDQGFRFFDMMRYEYGLAPNHHHYGCIVDLMGRAGLLDEAYKLVTKEMRVAPDATIWRTLLGACRVHGRVDLGERVISHLIELRAQQAGDYVLLSNTYAAAEDWKKVAEIRKLMKEKGIQTTPGCTTVELNGVVHEFIANDHSHPRKVEIYEKLNEINKHLKIAGYTPHVSSDLHDLDSEGKESALIYHSEKLAIAFALLVTPQRRPIRLAKNLRFCVDCHNFMKTFSGVYNRLVIVRDRTRFHHFEGGKCSCNDYW